MTMIGQPINRVDGPLKVSGQATYAYEHWDAGQPLYGFIVGATIGRGRITGIDTMTCFSAWRRTLYNPGSRSRSSAALSNRDIIASNGFSSSRKLSLSGRTSL